MQHFCDIKKIPDVTNECVLCNTKLTIIFHIHWNVWILWEYSPIKQDQKVRTPMKYRGRVLYEEIIRTDTLNEEAQTIAYPK